MTPPIGARLRRVLRPRRNRILLAVFACLVILFNLIADLLYGWLDPRISYR